MREPRPIHPKQAQLYERLEHVSRAIDSTLEAIGGERFAFVLAIVPPGEAIEYAGLTITNATDMQAAAAHLQYSINAIKEMADGRPD